MTAIDGEGPAKVAAATKIAGVNRLYPVSVFQEAWRERRMDDDFEHYMVEKKVETQLILTDLNWVMLRPSVLTDKQGVGTVNLGLFKIHDEIRGDHVAATLIALIENQDITRFILEVTGGSTPIGDAVATPRKLFHRNPITNRQ